MKNTSLSPLLVALLTIGPAASLNAAAAPDLAQLRKDAAVFFTPTPDQMPGADKDTPVQVALGKKLYFDKLLSENRTQSCNDCHRIDERQGGADAKPTSSGAFGKNGDRNSPTVLNAGFQFAQFWDGRAATLEDQAKGPILNPVEMAMPTEAEAVRRLNADAAYPGLFKQAFPEAASPATCDNLAKAIGAFERTLVTHDRFDDYLKGNDQALSAVEQQGLRLFLDTSCTTCHFGPVIGGASYQRVGLVNPYETKDVGRFGVTKDEDDQFKFKVPMLRNIALTAPYFHDGKWATLEDVVPKMAYHQIDKKLTDDEVKAIVSFLKTLTDKTRLARK